MSPDSPYEILVGGNGSWFKGPLSAKVKLQFYRDYCLLDQDADDHMDLFRNHDDHGKRIVTDEQLHNRLYFLLALVVSIELF